MIEKRYSELIAARERLRLWAVPRCRRLVRLAALPWCYFKLVDWRECPVPRWRVAADFLYIFFVLKTFPDNYAACRLWEKERHEWAKYYGSGYDPYQRARLQREVQRPRYEILFADKEVCSLLLAEAGLPAPRLHGVVDPGPGFRERLAAIAIASGRETLFLKPVSGSAGRAAAAVDVEGGDVFVRTSAGRTPLGEFRLTERSLLQDVVESHPEVASLSPGALSTIRMLTLMSRDGEAMLAGASMRFGIGGSLVDNWSAGGVAAGVDRATGRLAAAAYAKTGRSFDRHPDTGATFGSFTVPMWNRARELALSAQTAFPWYRLLGVDVAVSPRGPVIIEINPRPDIVFQEQTSGPLLADAGILREFAGYGLLVNEPQRRLAGV